VRRFLRDQQAEARQRIGREMFENELRKQHWSIERAQKEGDLKEWLARNDLTLEALFVEIATGQRPPAVLVRQVVRVAPESAIGRFIERLSRPKPASRSPVLISQADGVAVRFARCCQPLPGEPIRGYVTLHQGITVHRAGCTQLLQAEPDRLLDTDWKDGVETRQSVDLTLVCEDRKGLLASVTGACEAQNLNIEHLQTDGGRDGQALIRLRLAVRDHGELDRLIGTLRRVVGVGDVVRLAV
jgi:GTP pyrophosphokinase